MGLGCHHTRCPAGDDIIEVGHKGGTAVIGVLDGVQAEACVQ